MDIASSLALLLVVDIVDVAWIELVFDSTN